MGIISNIVAKLTLDNKKFDRGLTESKNKTSQFGVAIIKIGGAIGIAFAAKKILSFSDEMASLAVKVNGVTKAFEQLKGITLDELRRSTGGMVDDLQLMQKAVQAKNLGLPVQQLGTFFKFAALRAAETGENVDFLVNSIVTGIGRKSVMIMDNLGISALRLREETEKVGDFALAAANIINQELAASAITIDDITDGTIQMTSEWKNFSSAVATSGIGDFFNDLAKDAALAMKNITFLLRFDAATEGEKRVMSLFKLFAKTREEAGAAFGDVKHALIARLSELEKQGKKTGVVLDEAMSFVPSLRELELDQVTGALDFMQNLKEPKAFSAFLDKLFTVIQGGGGAKERIESSIKPIFGKDISGETKEPVSTATDDTKLLSKLANEATESFTILGRTMGEVPDMPAPSDEDIEAWKNMNVAVLDLSNALQNTLAQALMAVGEALGTIIAGGGIENALQLFIQTIGGLMKQFGALLISWGIAQIALKASISNPYAAIAAGIALVAIGAAISKSQRQVTGSSGGGFGGSVGGGQGFSGTGFYSGPGFNGQGGNTIILKAQGADLVAVIDEQTLRNITNG